MAELSGAQGISRQAVEAFIQNVFAVPISMGAIQKMTDRVSEALLPVHEAIGVSVRSAAVNHVDETSWQQAGALKWQWTMTNCVATFFIVHSNRSRKAFEALIDNWHEILVSDNCGASAPTAPRAKRAIAGRSDCYPSGRPAGCANRRPSRCWWIP